MANKQFAPDGPIWPMSGQESRVSWLYLILIKTRTSDAA